jgi:hypothetical protein
MRKIQPWGGTGTEEWGAYGPTGGPQNVRFGKNLVAPKQLRSKPNGIRRWRQMGAARAGNQANVASLPIKKDGLAVSAPRPGLKRLLGMIGKPVDSPLEG